MKIFCLACFAFLSLAVCAQKDTSDAIYTGKYTVKDGSKISVYIESGKLTISGDKGTAPLVREKVDSFSIEGYGGAGYIKFLRSKSPAAISGVHVYLPDMNIDVIADKDSVAGTSFININAAAGKVPAILAKGPGIHEGAFLTWRELLAANDKRPDYNNGIRKI
ncbi:hypothetical protein [Niabella soli]|uniref:Auto-transporter adhesin head GIN domain-containing protein n=1 Tax=Niabella soli DSM 19437 TaxID=929713 RepID=W0F6Q4_9BACT|nr:hypothetical protein [Niabella soli]AHF17508.1 hypothetical protein NIASO_09005 [Niabella soli DSM 19437]